MENQKKLILIVEDEQPLSKALGIKLALEGFRINSAANGKAGLEIALREKPDLILLDIAMPVMDGISMLQELRKDSWGSNANVIVLTNLGSDTTKIAAAMEKDVTEYFIKSDISLEQIADKIKDKLHTTKS